MLRASKTGGGAGVNPAPTVKVWMGEEFEVEDRFVQLWFN
jgi:hypothetical protein